MYMIQMNTLTISSILSPESRLNGDAAIWASVTRRICILLLSLTGIYALVVIIKWISLFGSMTLIFPRGTGAARYTEKYIPTLTNAVDACMAVTLKFL